MSVPADPASHDVEELRRPDRPQTPGQTVTPATVDRSVADRSAVIEQVGESGTHTFTTKSGRTLKIDVDRVPVARLKKKAIRFSVILIFVLVLAGVAGGVVAAVLILLASTETPRATPVDPRDAHRAALGYDPAVNPFLEASANFLGVGVKSDVCLVVDGSATRLGWFEPVKKSVRFLAGKGGRDLQLRVVYSLEEGSRSYPPPSGAAEAEPESLGDFLNSVKARGAADLGPAAKIALAGGPQQLILVTEQQIFDDQIQELSTLLDSAPGVQLDVILIQTSAPVLSELARQRGGRCLTLSTRQIVQWQAEAGPVATEMGAAETSVEPSN